MDKATLQARQPVVGKILFNALKHKQPSHAYLFVGPKGSKMLETALLFAQSLICKNADPWACGTCDSCTRIAEGVFADMVVLDGTMQSIKKEEILGLQEKFAKTALETYGRKFYILNAAENATPEALNSLLKFLEEPSGHDTYAILISEKPERLLETIVSRCQTLTFRAQNRQELIEELRHEALDPYEIHLISQLVNDKEEMLELLKSDAYRSALSQFGVFIDEYTKAPYLGELFAQNQLLKKKDPASDRQGLTLFLNIGMMFFKDVLFQTPTESPVWRKRMLELPKGFNTLQAFTLFNDSVHKITTNANLSLLIDALIYQLKEEEA